MDDDPLPRASHATGSRFSPQYSPQLYALKSSSPPPLFSENDSLESADATVYESPRMKRKRAGTWWQTYAKAKKPRQFVRNVDSGVYMMSDDSDISLASGGAQSSSHLDATQDIASDPPAPPAPEHRDEGINVDRSIQTMSASEYAFYADVQEGVEKNATSWSFYHFGVEDSWLQHLEMLHQVVAVPPDASTEVPAEGQYRSMEPELHLNLGRNNLCRLSPTLFNLEFLVDLTLRNNYIKILPPQIAKLRHLRTLDLCFNHIRTLPCELLALCTRPTGVLRSLWLTGNPLVEVSNSEWFPNRARLNLKEMSWPGKVCEDDLKRDAILGCSLKRGHHLFAPSPQVSPNSIKDQITYVTRTTVAYYDRSGHLIADCPKLPMACQGDYDPPARSPRTQPGLMIETVHGTSNIPETWFEPPRRSKVKSLIAQSLITAYTMCETEPEAVREELREFLDGNDASLTNAEVHLAHAEYNADVVHSPLQTCHCCGKKYIIAAAEWIEGWCFDREIIPIRVAVCSWGCVPDLIAKRPASPVGKLL